MNASDSTYMRRALSLAARGKGKVNPNPMVGCVIVKSGRIVGQGTHSRFGGPHAEVLALRQAGPKARGATAYVTLEPCSHWGKTPPCAPALVRGGIKKVVAAMRDPNPLVAGKGFHTLKKGGVKLQIGVERAAAEALNRPFLTRFRLGRPYIVLKTAMTLDGKINTKNGFSRWISGETSRRLVHKLRAESDAVLIGAETAARDNPRLTSHGAGRNPLRIILDPRLRTVLNLHVYNDRQAPTLVVTSPKVAPGKMKFLENKGVQILRMTLKFGFIDVRKLVRELVKYNVNQLLIEGGGETSWGFVKARLVDEAFFFVAPLLLGGREAKTPVEGEGFRKLTRGLRLSLASVTRIGEDVLIRARRS